jgi:hypothetical protein
VMARNRPAGPVACGVIVMAEGSETPGGGAGTSPGSAGGAPSGGPGQTAGPSGRDPEGRVRGSEGDLLAERRARRAAESGDAALILRAETAEATVRTLETHVASLQQRVQEAEREAQRTSELLAAERAAPADDQRSSNEEELRRAKQREYAEQQLRVEAEDRCIDLERESRVEIERLSRRLAASERDARDLAGQLTSVQGELAEAQQSAAAELMIVRRAENEFQLRLVELERRALEISRGLGVERAARERAEREVETMRRVHRRMAELIRELRGVVARLRAAAATSPGGWGQVPKGSRRGEPESQRVELSRAPSSPPGGPGEAHRGEMAEALASAVERLRARVEDVGEAEDRGPQGGAGEDMPPLATSPAVADATPPAAPVVAMSPSEEPLTGPGRTWWWSAWRARRRARSAWRARRRSRGRP